MQDLHVGDVVELRLNAETSDALPYTATVVEVEPERQRIVVETGKKKMVVPVRCYHIRKIYTENV